MVPMRGFGCNQGGERNAGRSYAQRGGEGFPACLPGAG